MQGIGSAGTGVRALRSPRPSTEPGLLSSSAAATEVGRASLYPVDMPELPEVEAARQLLLTHCLGARFTTVQALTDEVHKPRKVALERCLYHISYKSFHFELTS